MRTTSIQKDLRGPSKALHIGDPYVHPEVRWRHGMRSLGFLQAYDHGRQYDAFRLADYQQGCRLHRTNPGQSVPSTTPQMMMTICSRTTVLTAHRAGSFLRNTAGGNEAFQPVLALAFC